MNDPSDKHTKLLADAFHDDWNAGSAVEFARSAAAHARRRRRVQHRLSAASVATAVVVMGLLALHRRAAEPRPPSSAPMPIARSYEIISDEELLSQLRDRPLLMIRSPDGAHAFIPLGN